MAKRDDNDSLMGNTDSWINELNSKLIVRAVQLIVTGIAAVVVSVSAHIVFPEEKVTTYSKLEARIHKLEITQSKDDMHREASASGYARIRNVENYCFVCEQKLRDLDRRINKLEGDTK